jgi:hypothetical protein
MLIGGEFLLPTAKSPESSNQVGKHIIIHHQWSASGAEFGSLTSENESYLQTSVVDYKSVLLRCHKTYVFPTLQTYSCSALDKSKGKTR